MIRRLARAVLVRWYRWQLECLRSERLGYQELAPQMLGPNYVAECDKQERVLRGRIAFLESGL